MRKSYLVNGFVQGVGFRPFIKKIADKFSLVGFVKNTSIGVKIEVEGSEKNLKHFYTSLTNDLPFPAGIFEINEEEVDEKKEKEFSILKSDSNESVRAFFPLDLALCDNCLNELKNKADRRFEYPFINCTSCGPRYTIISNLPYDRSSTTMASFVMCEDCLREYQDTNNRRYHAQPNACHKCGPKVELIYDSKKINGEEAFERASTFLNAGEVVAIKGLGGFHLACNACDDKAVQKLRIIKNRDKKPFAIMVANINVAKKICEIEDVENELLSSKIAPILLLKSKNNMVSKHVAPDNSKLGVFLPYTPVHFLLFQKKSPEILVMTSANDSMEPILCNDDEAIKRCEKLKIPILTNNRKISFRDDDSVIQLVSGKPQVLRGGRGYLPRPFALHERSSVSGIAMGSDLKNSFSVMLPGDNSLAMVSPFVGDLESPLAQEVLEKTIDEYLKIFDVKPSFVAIDMHPKYFSSIIGKKIAKKYSSKIIEVQHHHAHLASAMVENGLNEKVVGLALDGTGYGDGSIWGAECMILDFAEFNRVASIKPLALVGGDTAIKEPWRLAVSLLLESENKDLAVELFGLEKVLMIEKALSSNIPFIKTSGLGRLFDAVSCIALSENISNYEAELAIRFEQKYMNIEENGLYDYEWTNDDLQRLDFTKLILQSALDKIKNEPVEKISYKFHNTLAKALVDMVNTVHYDIPVVLSGGCMQNRVLFSLVKKLLEDQNRKVYTNNLLPVNDQSIALGQIAIANKIFKKDR